MLKKNQNLPAISIIVATRNRALALARFLEAAERLPPVPQWELVIADNGSTDGTASLIEGGAKKLPVVSIYAAHRGKSRALNAAMAVARGELLVFADDDIVPAPNWLSALYEASIAHPEVNVFGGKILVKHDAVPRWIVDSYNLHTLLLSKQDLGDRPRLFSFDDYPIGPNLAVRRFKLEERRASWPVGLGPGTKIPVGDERAFLMQLSLPGDTDRLYVPASVVVHCISGRQLSISTCVKRCFQGGFAAAAIRRRYRKTGSGTRGGVGVVLRRLSQCSSFWELGCISVRAIGVLAGRLSPYPEIVVNAAGIRRSHFGVGRSME